MPSLRVPLPPADLAALYVELELLRAQAPRARITPASVVVDLVRAHLRRRRDERSARAAALLEQFISVPRKVAADAFRRCRGAVPLDELQSAAALEALKAARKFDPRKVGATWEDLGAAPAPYLRFWAEKGVQALLGERQEDQRLVRPDDDERWERIVGTDSADHAQALALRSALASFSGPALRIVRLLAAGADYDQVAARLGLTVDEVRAAQAELRAHLQRHGIDHAPDEEVTLTEAAARTGHSVKALSKRVRAGKLRGRKLGGEWRVMLSEV